MWSRVWPWILGAAALLWLAVMVDRLGAVYVFGFIGLAVLFRYFGVDK